MQSAYSKSHADQLTRIKSIPRQMGYFLPKGDTSNRVATRETLSGRNTVRSISANANIIMDFHHPRIRTQISNRLQRLEKVPSYTMSSNSMQSYFNNHSNHREPKSKTTNKLNYKLSKKNLAIGFNQTGIKDINAKRNQKKRCAPSRYCCLVSILLCLLLAIGLASTFMAIFIKKTTSTTVTTTSTTTTSATTSTSNSQTSTTTTQTTSTTTSTSTTTTETTSTTTTATTSTTTTETTSTSSSTTSTTSTSTTTTTTANLCGGSISVPTSTIFQSTSFSSTSYIQCYFQWIPSTTGSFQLAFQFRSDIDHWHLDDVSINNGTTQILVNGGFEAGSFSPGWTRSTPNGNCLFSTPGTYVTGTFSHSGYYYADSWCSSLADQISQSFMAIAGKVYSVSFYLAVSGSVGTRSVTVTLS